mgnify:CR=1 FL=1
MNLSRAKTILIFAFLGLNLFLCFYLYGNVLSEPLRMRVSRKQWREIEEQLERNGYILAAQVDRSARKSAFLTVSPSKAPEKAIRERFALSPTPSTDSAGALLFEGRQAKLKVFPEGLLRLEFTPGIALMEETAADEEAAPAPYVENFLREKGLAPDEFYYDHATTIDGKTVLHYLQSCEGAPLFSGYLKAIMENNTLIALELSLLEPKKPLQGQEMEVISSARALLRLIEIRGASSPPRQIVKADLGFYSRSYDADEWEMPPVWRFLFDSGESIFINAFTGNLEPETSN